MIQLKTLAALTAALTFWSTTGFAATHETLNRNVMTAEIPKDYQASDLPAARAELVQRLETGDFKEELASAGVSREEAQLRLAAMSDSEIHQILKGEQRQAGGEVIVISVGAAILIVLLLILLLRPVAVVR